MKKIFLPSVLAVIFGISFPQAQPSRLDSVITKFQNDNRSFEEYIVLGRMACYNKLRGYKNVINESETYIYLSSQLYNSLSPFARLLNEQSTIKSLEEYFLLNIKHFEEIDEREYWFDKENSFYYKQVKLCDSLFNKNKDYRKQYLKLVNDKENYLKCFNGKEK